MAFGSNGNFARLWSFVTERVNNQDVFRARLDDEFDGITTGLTAVNLRMLDTKSALESATVPASGVDTVVLRGYTSAGDGGGALYVRAASEPSHDGKIQSDDGAWWELAPGVTITPFTFGAQEDTDSQEEAIESFFAWCHDHMSGGVSGFTASHQGSFRVSRPVLIPEISRVTFGEGHLTLTPNSGITDTWEYGIRFHGADNSKFGHVTFTGSSGLYVKNGVLVTRARQSKWRRITGTHCRLFGVVIASGTDDDLSGVGANNNNMTVDYIRANNCGYPEGEDVAFEEVSRSYSANSPNQTSTISADLGEWFPTHQHNVPFRYDGKWYVILDYDDVAEEAEIYPCLAEGDPDSGGDALVSGTGLIVPGGGLLLRGNDSNLIQFQHVNVRTSSCVAVLSGAYGSTIAGITGHFNGINIVHGNAPSSVANIGGTIIDPYFEETGLTGALTTSSNSKIVILGAMTRMWPHVFLRPLPNGSVQREAGNQAIRYIGESHGFADETLGGPPRVVSHRRGTPGTANHPPGGSSLDLMAHPGGIVIVSPDTSSRDFTYNLGVDNTNTDAYGPSGFAIIGINWSSGNDITLVAPDGETIHGETQTEVFTGLPSYFWMACGRESTTDWRVVIVEMDSAESYRVT